MSAPDEPLPAPAGGPAHAEGERAGDASPRPDAPGTPTCDVCGAPMYERHCRIICPRCGYQRDCTDP